jgi:phosphocarrier protein FPr
MVEVPAAALKAAAFDPHVDFFSIGTNDLTQYTLAAERGNDTVASLGDPFDPGVLRLIDSVCRAASGGTSVAVCGELAADERATALLLGLGVDELSVAPRAVPGVKQAVRGVHRAQARALAADALTAHSADAVRALIPSADRAG